MQKNYQTEIKNKIEQLEKDIDNTIKGYNKTNKLITQIQKNIDENSISELKANTKSLIQTLDKSIQSLTNANNYSTRGIFSTQPEYKTLEALKTMRNDLQTSYTELKQDIKTHKTPRTELKENLQQSLNQIKGIFSEATQFLTSMKDKLNTFVQKTAKSFKKELQNIKQDATQLKDLAREAKEQTDEFKENSKNTTLKAKLFAFGDLISNITDKTMLPYIAKDFFGLHGFKKETKTTDKQQDNLDQQIKEAEKKLSELKNTKEEISQENNQITQDWITLVKQQGNLKSMLEEYENKINALEKQSITNKKSHINPLEQSQKHKAELSNSLNKVTATIDTLEKKNQKLFNERKEIDDQISQQTNILNGLNEKRNAHAKEQTNTSTSKTPSTNQQDSRKMINLDQHQSVKECVLDLKKTLTQKNVNGQNQENKENVDLNSQGAHKNSGYNR